MIKLSNIENCNECKHKCIKNDLTTNSMQLINENKSEQEILAGEVIIRQGSFISQIAYLKKGVVKKVIEGKNDRNTIIKIIEGESFLALPVLGSVDKYPFSIVTLTDCKICFIKKDIFCKEFIHNKNIGGFLIDSISDDYNYMYGKMVTISTRNNHGKLATALLYLTDNIFKTDVLNTLSRKELSEFSSISKESTNKILQQMNHDGLIEIRRDKIKIKRRDLLEKLSTVG